VGTPIEKTDAVVRDISRFIMSFGPGQAESTSGSAGFYEDQDYTRHSGNHYGQIVVTLPEKRLQQFPDNPENDPMRYLEDVRRRIQEYSARKFGAGAQATVVKVFEEADGPPTGKAVNIRVTAPSLERALAAGDALLAYMRAAPALSALIDLGDDRPAFYETIRFRAKAEAALVYGLSAAEVTALVGGVLYGQYAGDYRSRDDEVDLLVRVARAADAGGRGGSGISDPLEVLDVPAIEDAAAPVLLRDVVEAVTVQEPSVRSRYKGKPTLTITADIRSGAKLSASRVQHLVAEHFAGLRESFPDVSLSYGGEFESTGKSYTSLVFAFFIAVIAIYLVLSSQFNDYFQPLIIISAVPFALIGVVVGLVVTGTTFTIGSFMAIVGLAGVAVNDAILLIDFINARRRSGMPMREAVVAACAARMRPVLVTTVTTVLGLLPMAIGIPSKSISWSPMAVAFAAGMVSATALTLLVTPANYELFEKIKQVLRRVKGRIA
jgi:HAE1 family hydrophobic/amphiphilic exporter-1